MSADDRKIAERMLMTELKELDKENWVNVEARDGNLFLWDVALIVLNPTSLYHGAYLKAELKIPKNYPMSPPEFKFLRPLFHPNIYKDGRLCISILHSPGDDEMSGELASERWSAAQRIFTVLISILSLLDDAEVSSAANVDASVMLRKDPENYKRIVKENVEASKRDIPEDFQMPTEIESKPPPKEEIDDDFWCDDHESDWDSNSDGDMEFEDENDESGDE
ncbi:ubiquitin-conjugating enzyme/RWD-like protein [Pyronema domesticum]|uniref:Ubiquitin-conjugating enzyme E2 2 n=1 Tax=Pyronema omphalodes (strain CBS 100304) TaxID=1076935 RepID=U4L6C0_PYROM|nr:ubiquitin-conjugating enzyme/RWD-like protein [Pyronema domesticum]CCX12020.1 Similar to Ubiquitin-conjugating enzyme E2-34 kDa; acc. no. P14682 [Pyronema omphalodes CBS 100304]